MHRIDGDAHVGNLFDEGDPGVPTNPTQITAKWLNAVQEEIVNFCLNRGITLSDVNDEQLLEALHAVVPSSGTYGKQTMTLQNTFATAGGYTVKAYRTIGGIVRMEGAASHPSEGQSVVAFTLPSDLRPSSARTVLAYVAGDNRPAAVSIATNGEVIVAKVRNYDGETLGTDAVVFDNVAFSL